MSNVIGEANINLRLSLVNFQQDVYERVSRKYTVQAFI